MVGCPSRERRKKSGGGEEGAPGCWAMTGDVNGIRLPVCGSSLLFIGLLAQNEDVRTSAGTPRESVSA